MSEIGFDGAPGSETGDRPVRFSLIMCTVDRLTEPRSFLRSLARQTYRNFELFIVDQNEDDRIARLVSEFDGVIPYTILRSSRGLSRARNVALANVTGDIVAFPDDDCTYPEALLAGVADQFSSNPSWEGLCVRRSDGFVPPCEFISASRLSRLNVWGRVPSISLFLRADLVHRVGNFDESLGAGAGTPWGAGEDTDFVLRALAQGARLYRVPTLQVLHPPPQRLPGTAGRKRARAYARGLGRVLRKSRLPMWMVLGGCLLSAARALAAALRGNSVESSWHFQTLLGRVEGWWAKR